MRIYRNLRSSTFAAYRLRQPRLRIDPSSPSATKVLVFRIIIAVSCYHTGTEAVRNFSLSIEKAGLPIITANQPVTHGSVPSATRGQSRYRVFWGPSHFPKYVTGWCSSEEDLPLVELLPESHQAQLFGSPAT